MPSSPFGFEKPEDSLGFLLWQTTTTWQRLLKEALDKHKVSHTHFVVMATTLWFQERKQLVTQVMIAKLTKLDKMSVSKGLKSLVARGLVKREEDQTDTRAKTVKLSHKGKALISKLIPIVEKNDKKFFSALGAKQQNSLLQIFHKILSTEKQDERK